MSKRRDSPLISTSTVDSNNGGSAEDMESGIESDRGYAEVLTPQQPHQNGRLPNTRSTESMLNRAASRDCQQHRNNYEYKQMEAKNKRQQLIFYTMMVLCFLVTLAYIAVIVFVLARSQINLDSQSSPGSTRTATAQGLKSGQSNHPKFPYCVVEADIRVYAELYDGRIPFLKADRDNICFNSLEWFPKFVLRVNASIQNRAAMIEDKHKKMSVDLDRIGFNRNTNTLAKLDVPALSPEDMSSSRYPVFAHLYLNNTADHSDALKWKKDGVDESRKQRVGVDRSTGEVIVRESGSYFVYSHVMFNKKHGSISHWHWVVKNLRAGNAKEVLLETDQGPASVLQGVFRLIVNDTLSVVASHDQLNKDSGRSTYFGTYLMRT